MKEGRKKEKKRKMQAKPVSGNLFFSLPGKKKQEKERESCASEKKCQ